MLSFALDGAAFDVERDVDSLVLALQNPTVGNPSQPQVQDSVAVLTGKIGPKKVVAAATKQFGKLAKRKQGKMTIYTADSFEFAFVEPHTLVMVNEGAFAKKVWAAVADAKQSAGANAHVTKLMKSVDTSKGLWVTAWTKGMPQSRGPKMDGAAVAVDVRSGLNINIKSTMATKKDADTAMQQVEGMKKQGGKNPMILMMGVKPLIDNLTTTRQKKIVDMKTHMAKSEVAAMVQKLKAMQQQPAPMGPTKGPKPGVGPVRSGVSTQPTDGASKGADADFN